MHATPQMRDSGRTKKRRSAPYLVNSFFTEEHARACFSRVWPDHLCERCSWMWTCIKINESAKEATDDL